MSNDNTQVAKKITFGQFLNFTGTQSLIQKTLGDEKHAQRFCASILSAVSVTPGLQECDPKTVLSGAFLGDALNWSPSPQLGQFYLVPFGAKNNPDGYGKVAVFIPGYKGLMQLGIRSGQFRRIVPLEIKQGEIVSPWNPLFETIALNFIEDESKRDAAPTVGYYIEIELVKGFRKAMYWSKDRMLVHANRFSKAFNKDQYRLLIEGKIPGISLKDIQEGKYFEDKALYVAAQKMSSFWYKDFDVMAKKTMIRQIFGGGYCPMSVDMQMAYDADEKVINPITLTPDADGVYDEAPAPEELQNPDDYVPPFVAGTETAKKERAAKQAKMDEV